MSKSRRDFVKTAAGMGLAASLSSAAAAGSIPRRKFGKTGLELSLMSLGGGRVGTLLDTKQALDTIRRCYDLGVNYFDTASAGAYGISQLRYGAALADVRDKIIIGTKTRHRTFAHSELDLNQSLSNMKTDYLDLYQVHNVMHEEDINFIFGPRGVMEMIEKAKKAGKIRFVGVTGHMNPHVLVKILGMYDFDAVLMPLSISDGANRAFSFERITLPVAVKMGIGVIAMKVTGNAGLLNNRVATVGECLNYAWSLPISTSILGCRTVEEVETDHRLVTTAKKLTPTQMSEFRKKASNVDFAKLEPWKTPPAPALAGVRRYLGD